MESGLQTIESVDTTMENLSLLLLIKGYDEYLLQAGEKMFAFMNKIRQAFDEAILRAHRSQMIESFYVETKGVLGEQRDEIYFKFHFQYDPKNQKLSIPELYANMGTVERIFPAASLEQLPSASQVHLSIRLTEKLDQLKRIVQHDPGRHKPKIK